MRKALPWLLLTALVAFLAYKLATSHFDWAGFVASIHRADPRLLALAILLMYSNNVIRALRWALFLRPAAKLAGRAPTAWYQLIGTQFMGFTSLALFGRLGELIRPLLVSRRTDYPFSSQIALVAVERIFDLGALAVLFSLNLLLSPDLNRLPNHERFRQVGVVVALLTLVLAAFVIGVRVAGAAVASGVESLIGKISKPAGSSAAAKVLIFRDGLNVIDSVRDFILAAGLSVMLWVSIALAYVCVMKAFPSPVNTLSIADCVVLTGLSVVGNLVQLPGVGGGAQFMTIGALTKLFLVPAELATSAGLMVWLIGSWSIVPAGLIFARIEGISLKQSAASVEATEQPAMSADASAEVTRAQK